MISLNRDLRAIPGKRYTDARADLDEVSFDLQGSTESRPLRNTLDVAFAGHIPNEHGEFIASQTADHFVVANSTPQPPRHLRERGMSSRKFMMRAACARPFYVTAF